MHADENRGRTPDPVDEASGGSFPASDPPAWTAARSGRPARQGTSEARLADAGPSYGHCDVVGLFRSNAEAAPAADALLSSGFNLVDIGPPRRHGNLDAGIGRPLSTRGSVALNAALGAVAATAIAALLMPRGTRHVAAAAIGGTVGAISSRAAARVIQQRDEARDWPPNAALLRVHVKSQDDEKRALAILEVHGACKVHMNWQRAL